MNEPLSVSADGNFDAAFAAAGDDQGAVDVVKTVFLSDRLRESQRLVDVDVDHLAAVRADEMVVFFQRRFIFGATAGVREDLDQADAAQDVESAVDRSEA